MEKWKKQMKESLELKRQLDLNSIFEELDEFPDIIKDDDGDHYKNQLYSKILDKRSVFINSFEEGTPLNGRLEDNPQQDMKFVFETWNIQRKVNHEFLEKFDDNVR